MVDMVFKKDQREFANDIERELYLLSVSTTTKPNRKSVGMLGTVIAGYALSTHFIYYRYA